MDTRIVLMQCGVMVAAAAAARIAELEAQVHQRDELIATMQAQLRALEARVAAMQQRIFGRSWERLHDPNRQSIDFGQGASGPFAAAAPAEDAAAIASDDAAGPNDDQERPPGHGRGRRRRGLK